MDASGDGAFEAFVATGSPRLLRAAYLLCGDWGHAEDLLQSALVKTWLHWSKLREPESAEAYARTVLLRTYLRTRRRRWSGEVPTQDLPEQRSADEQARYDDHDAVMHALAALPPRVRAVIVLRFFEDLTEADIATTLNCPLGTVKSSLSRGLATLRTQQGVTT